MTKNSTFLEQSYFCDKSGFPTWEVTDAKMLDEKCWM
jgi:hypothetical protein